MFLPTLTSERESFSIFLGQSFFKCSTLPQKRQPPPLGYSPRGLSGQALAKWPVWWHMKQVANWKACSPFFLDLQFQVQMLKYKWQCRSTKLNFTSYQVIPQLSFVLRINSAFILNHLFQLMNIVICALTIESITSSLLTIIFAPITVLYCYIFWRSKLRRQKMKDSVPIFWAF